MNIRARERLAAVGMAAILGGGAALGLAFGGGPSGPSNADASGVTLRVLLAVRFPSGRGAELRHQLEQLRRGCRGTHSRVDPLSTEGWVDAIVPGTTDFDFSGRRLHGLTFDLVPAPLRRALGVRVTGSVDSDPLVFVGGHEVAVALVRDGEIVGLLSIPCRGEA